MNSQESSIPINLNLLGETEENITCVAYGAKYILTGHPKGIINTFNINSDNKGQIVSSFKLHAEPITNLILINKPISSYGLNVNTKINETVVRKLKKPGSEISKSKFLISSSIKNKDIILNLLSNYNNNHQTFNSNSKIKNKDNFLTLFGDSNYNIEIEKQYSKNIIDVKIKEETEDLNKPTYLNKKRKNE